MAKFKVLQTRMLAEPRTAEFQIEVIDTPPNEGDTFKTFETHHPNVWTILSVMKTTPVRMICASDWSTGLGWDNNYTPSLVDTNGRNRLECFKYIVKGNED